MKVSCWILCKSCRHEQYGAYCKDQKKIITEKCKQCGADQSMLKALTVYGGAK